MQNWHFLKSTCVIRGAPLRGDIKILSQNSISLTTNFSQKLRQPSKGISYPVGDLCRYFTKQTGPSASTLQVIRYPQQIVQMTFCDLSHTYHKQVTNVSLACFGHSTAGNFDVPTNVWLQRTMEDRSQRIRLHYNKEHFKDRI